MKSFSFAPSFKQYRDIAYRYCLSISNYFKYKPRFNGVFSRNNLPRIKYGAYLINLNDKNSKGTHWISLFVDRNTAVYFDSFGIEFTTQDLLSKIRDKSITHNVFRIQDNESIICGFYSIAYRIYACSKNLVRLY